MVQEQLQPLYFLSRKKGRSDGKCPVYYRVTIEGIPEGYSSGIFVLPEKWDNAAKASYGQPKWWNCYL